MKEGKRYEMNFIPLQARSLYWGFFLMLHQHVLPATFDQFSGRLSGKNKTGASVCCGAV